MQEQQTTQVAEYSQTEAALTALREKYEDVVFEVSTKEGDKTARDARRELVSLRTSLEDRRKELKAPLLKRSRAIDEEAQRLAGEILALEGPIDDQIKAEEKRKEAERTAREAAEAAEREAKAKAEKARIDAVQAKIKAITDKPIEVLGKKPLDIENAIHQLEFMPVTDVEFEEFVIDVSEARATTVAKLREMHAQAIHREEEEKRLAAEQAELDRRRQEQEAREAEQRKQQEEIERKARLQQQEAERIEREAKKLAEQRAEQARREKEAKERSEREAKEAKERAEREAKEAKERAEREAKEAKERAEREAADARQREIEKAETLRMDAQQMLNTFSARYGHLEEFAGVNKAITSYFEQIKVAA